MENNQEYTKKDFVSDQEVRWCPGCGDYSILSALQNIMPKIGKKREEIVFVSGIGCSSRLPYYMNTYGLHTIHGRPIAVATGLKIHNPELSVWAITGDGDGLSIGGNHTIHALRRNVDIKVILFNNKIYGLTKGQFSPTTDYGTVTKTSPYGSIDRPFSAASLAIGAGATFFARTLDVDIKHMQEVFLAAANHRGTSFVEVLQNCVIFNDGAHDWITDKENREDRILRLEHGKPMLFGKNRDKGIMLDGINPIVVTLGEAGITEKDILIHDAKAPRSTLAYFLSKFSAPAFPFPVGVYRAVGASNYENEVDTQIKNVREKKGVGDLQKYLESGEIWSV